MLQQLINIKTDQTRAKHANTYPANPSIKSEISSLMVASRLDAQCMYLSDTNGGPFSQQAEISSLWWRLD
jgi:hypothetical protein